jgi:SAM-dependent methyltransferase
MNAACRSELNQQWIQLAPAWIEEVRNGRNSLRVGVLDKPMLDACGEVRGLTVLDSGCGEGRFSRVLIDRGADRVLGLDFCEPMIIAAKALNAGRDEYRVADVQDLSFLGDHIFDLAVSYLNQCDLPDFAVNNREIFRVLRPGGRLIVANLHPMRSATGAWQTADDGTKQHAILDRYLDEGERRWKMMGVEFTNFHRTLSTYVRSYRDSGFTIEEITEPTVQKDGLMRYPELEDELRVPNFIIFVLKKPSP